MGIHVTLKYLNQFLVGVCVCVYSSQPEIEAVIPSYTLMHNESYPTLNQPKEFDSGTLTNNICRLFSQHWVNRRILAQELCHTMKYESVIPVRILHMGQ